MAEASSSASGACCAIANDPNAEKAAIENVVRSFLMCLCLLFMSAPSLGRECLLSVKG